MKKRYDMEIRDLSDSECQKVMDLCRLNAIGFTVHPQVKRMLTEEEIKSRIAKYKSEQSQHVCSTLDYVKYGALVKELEEVLER